MFISEFNCEVYLRFNGEYIELEEIESEEELEDYCEKYGLLNVITKFNDYDGETVEYIVAPIDIEDFKYSSHIPEELHPIYAKYLEEKGVDWKSKLEKYR